jgi:hypothetical protein
LIAVLVVGGLAAMSLHRGAGSRPAAPTVAFVVALRTFESQSVALADQASVQASTSRLQDAARTVADDSRTVDADLWALLDRWQIPGVQRLPGAGVGGGGPVAGLRHACALVANDELALLSTAKGPAFDQGFVSAWIAHADNAEIALKQAPSLSVAREATARLAKDVSVLAAV